MTGKKMGSSRKLGPFRCFPFAPSVVRIVQNTNTHETLEIDLSLVIGCRPSRNAVIKVFRRVDAARIQV